MDIAKIKADRAKVDEIMEFYGVRPLNNPHRPYDLFQTTTGDGVEVKGYRTKSPDSFTVVFMGGHGNALLEAQTFEKNAKAIVRTGSGNYDDIGEQIGSDEVGVGDFFGPMVVTATYFLPSEMGLLKQLGVKDSKKLTDAHMLYIGKRLCNGIKHYTVLCSANKVDSYISKGFSTHWLLARLHNLAHSKLEEKYGISNAVTVFVDQFEREGLYRKYVGSAIIRNPIIFKTKGESHYPSVAAASVIARYEFLEYWEKMEKELGMIIPKGAGPDVDDAYHRCVEINGSAKAAKYVKRFFRNYRIPR